MSSAFGGPRVHGPWVKDPAGWVTLGDLLKEVGTVLGKEGRSETEGDTG